MQERHGLRSRADRCLELVLSERLAGLNWHASFGHGGIVLPGAREDLVRDAVRRRRGGLVAALRYIVDAMASRGFGGIAARGCS
jgi:hypothetical protein